MSKRREYWTQGSELYVIGPSKEDPTKLVSIKIGGVTDVSMPEPSRNKVDITTLDETDVEVSMPGLLASSEMTVTNNYLDDDPGQIYVESMEGSEINLTFVVGFSKGKGIKPVVSGDSYTLPNTRGWCRFIGELLNTGIQTPQNAAMPFIFKVDVTKKPELLRKGRALDGAQTPPSEDETK